MQDQIQTRVINRIRKMIRLANDAGATEGERDNAMRMAHATLAKYNISLTDIESGENQEERKRISQEYIGKPWARIAANAIARLYFCHYYSSRGKGDKVKHTFIGRYSNAITAQEIAYFVITAMHEEGMRYQRTNDDAGAYRSFTLGAAYRVQDRCTELRQEAEKQGMKADEEDVIKTPGTSLVIANLYKTEHDANREYMESLGVRLKTGRRVSSRGLDRFAFSDGVTYGGTISLNRQVK